MAAAFRGDPSLRNLRRTIIEWHTKLPGMMALCGGDRARAAVAPVELAGFRGWDRRGFRQAVMNEFAGFANGCSGAINAV